jgi:hypothetical protein
MLVTSQSAWQSTLITLGFARNRYIRVRRFTNASYAKPRPSGRAPRSTLLSM